MRMLDDAALREKGIKFSRQHRQRLIKAGLFPAPAKMGANTNAWLEAEIDAWLQDRVAERDAKRARKDSPATVAEARA
jgi:prophage regulatory protein